MWRSSSREAFIWWEKIGAICSPPPLVVCRGMLLEVCVPHFFSRPGLVILDRVGQLDALLVVLSPLVMRHLFTSLYDFFFFPFCFLCSHGSR